MFKFAINFLNFSFFLISLNLKIAQSKQDSDNPVLIISFDGLRNDKLNDFLLEFPNSNFNKLIKNGVRAEYMYPCFPSHTFPNHFSLVTGLYPESHGIIGNTFYYPEYDIKVELYNEKQAKYWNKSDPIWVTARQQGLKTASSFWVGSEVRGRQPDIFLNYGDNFQDSERIDILINWLKKFKIDFLTLYFDEPDKTGHKFGPNGIEYKQKIAEMDLVLGYLLKKLEQESLKLNIIIVSDHGMAQLDKNFLITLDNYLDMNLIDMNKTVLTTVSHIYPKSNETSNTIFNIMSTIPNLNVYKKNDIPNEYNYKNSIRIAPIVAVAKEGYILSTGQKTWNSGGTHGYNNSIDSMKAIFIAHGPDFKSDGHKIKPFRNVDVYPLICHLLKMKCNPNNGTIESFYGALNSSTKIKTNSNSIHILIFSFIFYFNY